MAVPSRFLFSFITPLKVIGDVRWSVLPEGRPPPAAATDEEEDADVDSLSPAGAAADEDEDASAFDPKRDPQNPMMMLLRFSYFGTTEKKEKDETKKREEDFGVSVASMKL